MNPQDQRTLVVIFDGPLTTIYSELELVVWGVEYHAYENGMSQVTGKTQDVMLLIGALAEESIGLVDVTALQEEPCNT